jgi:hypothetical protein
MPSQDTFEAPAGVVTLTVHNAESGLSHSIILGPGEDGIEDLKRKLAASAEITADNQILLAGPPFHYLDPLYKRAPLPEGQQIFLYDRSLIIQGGDGNPDDLDTNLASLEPPPPTIPTDPSPRPPTLLAGSAGVGDSSPLLQTISTFERQFMLALDKGRAYAEAAPSRVVAAQEAVRIARTRDSARLAALSNLSVHQESLRAEYLQICKTLEDQKQRHDTLLRRFDEDLERLGAIRLHPALVAVSEGRTTLLDCIPMDRERALLGSCQQSHRLMATRTGEMMAAWERVSSGKVVGDSPRIWLPSDDDLARGNAWVAEQEHRLTQLRENYDAALKTATGLGFDSGLAMGAIHELNTLFTAQQGVVPAMIAADSSLRQLAARGEAAALLSHSHLRKALQEVAHIQCEIQGVQNWTRFMARALEQKEEQFSHLAKLHHMPAAYEAFLNEVVRRKAHHKLIKATISEVVESCAALRSREIVARDAFRRNHLINLPMLFLDLAPGLTQQQPPHFDPNLMELDSDSSPKLPNIQVVDIADSSTDAMVFQPDGDVGRGANTTKRKSDAALAYENGLLRAEVLRLKGLLQEEREKMQTGEEEEEVSSEEAETELEALRRGLSHMEGMVRSWAAQDDEMGEGEGHEGQQGGSSSRTTPTPIRTGREGHEVLASRVSAVESALRAWQDRFKRVMMEVDHRGEEISSLTAELGNIAHARISFRSFHVGDTVLFLPTTSHMGHSIYLAFHEGCPHYYLSRESLAEAAHADGGGPPDFILSKILMLEEMEAGESPESNPYGIAPGTMYHVVTATKWMDE